MNVSINDEFTNMEEAFDWTARDILSVQDLATHAAYCDAKKKAMLRMPQGDHAADMGCWPKPSEAGTCAHQFARRVVLRKRPTTPRVFRKALNDREFSVLHDPETGKRHVIPLRPGAEAKVIHATLGPESLVRPSGLTADDKRMNSDRA